MSNIVIVGSGPAGVSAALYAVRAGVQTTVLTKGSGALARAEKIENYYGFAQPVSGPELERRSIENARRLGVQFVQTEAVGLTWTDRLTVETLAGAYPADAVILATGASRAVPRIPGLTGLEGHGVSWCAACDAFFYRGKDVAVLGSGEYALHEVQALLPVVKSVTLLTNGAALTADFPPEVSVCTQKVEAILGEQAVTGVQLADGAVRAVSGVFVALGVAGSTALARKLGAAVEGSRIVVDDKMQTTRPVRRRGLHRRAVAGGKGRLRGRTGGHGSRQGAAKGVNRMAEASPHARCLACAFPFWEQLTPEEQERLCRFTRPVHYAKGARVHSPLESCVGILLLRSGQLRSYLLSEDGRDVTLYRLFGGEVCILSASCVMDAVNIDLYIDAEEDTEALCISAGIFRQLMQENVYVRCYAYQMTAERFSDTMWTMQQILFMSADRRLAIFLTDELAKTGGADLRMTHDQMAKYMGSAREVVSRMLKYFAQEGWVRLYRGGVQVLDKKKLQALARGE